MELEVGDLTEKIIGAAIGPHKVELLIDFKVAVLKEGLRRKVL